MISLMGLNTDKSSGVTISRYCASGSEAVRLLLLKFKQNGGCIITGGAESMSFIPMGGYKPVPESHYTKSNPDYY